MKNKIKADIYKLLLSVASLRITGLLLRLIIKSLPRRRSPVTLHLLASISYRMNLRPATSLTILKKITSPEAMNDPKVIKEFAEVYFALGEYQRASKFYQNLLTLNGPEGDTKIYHKLIKSLRLSSKVEAAYFVCGIANSYFPNDKNILTEYIRVLRMLNKYGAIASLLKKKAFDDLSLDHQMILLQSLVENRDFYSLEKLLDILVVEKQPYYLIAKAKMLTEQKKWQEAYKVWDFIYDNRHNPVYNFKLSEIRTAAFNREVISIILNPKAYRNIVKRDSTKKNKIALVTSYTKGYDKLKPHKNVSEKIDYLAFTDEQKANDYGLFNIHPLPIDEQDGRLSTRYAKMQPHKFLKDYDIVVWLDTSIMIVDDVMPYIEKFIDSNLAVASTPHTHRNTVLEEMIICAEIGKDTIANLEHQYNSMKDQDLENIQLFENGMLMFNMNRIEGAVEKALDEWWRHVNQYSKRDQLSFGYSMKKHGIDVHNIVDKPSNINNNPSLLLMPHNTTFTALEELEKTL